MIVDHVVKKKKKRGVAHKTSKLQTLKFQNYKSKYKIQETEQFILFYFLPLSLSHCFVNTYTRNMSTKVFVVGTLVFGFILVIS